MDQVVFMFGMPTKVTGFIGSQREHNPDGFEDSCTVLMHYDGMMATMKASVISLETAQLRYWVRGQKGSYKKVGCPPPPELILRANIVPVLPRWARR